MAYSNRASGILAILSDRPVAYHPKLARVVGVKQTIFLCQLLYWDGKGKQPDGWIWKTQAEMEEETGLSRTEQETARKHLRNAGILEEKRAGVPAKLHYRINFDILAEAIEEAYPAETSNQDCGNPANCDAETPQTITESTTETTTPNTIYPQDEASASSVTGKKNGHRVKEKRRVSNNALSHLRHVNALIAAYKFDPALMTQAQTNRMHSYAKRIRSAGYTTEHIRLAGRYWWQQDWRGLKGQTPKEEFFSEWLSKVREQQPGG